MAEDGAHAYCNQDEVANYLARMHKHDYMAGMTDILNKVFDGATLTKRNSRKKGNQPNKWTIKRTPTITNSTCHYSRKV